MPFESPGLSGCATWATACVTQVPTLHCVHLPSTGHPSSTILGVRYNRSLLHTVIYRVTFFVYYVWMDSGFQGPSQLYTEYIFPYKGVILKWSYIYIYI